ncbi:MAG TPA: heavy metal-binding domain-containing protein, partial [Polyangiaceae bacterium]|nr:heavy metal-binding domain-containing protein [Polyangiaceae bacterium]
HPSFPQTGNDPARVVTSELNGAEIFSLAQMGYAPVQLVMATSVYSLGLVGGIGALFSSLARGELSELTQLVYGARENCLALLRQEAQELGAERVIGNRLQIRELAPGLIEVVAVGTAVRQLEGIAPHSPNLPFQAIVRDEDSLTLRGGGSAGFSESMAFGSGVERRIQGQMAASGCMVVLAVIFMLIMGVAVGMLLMSR